MPAGSPTPTTASDPERGPAPAGVRWALVGILALAFALRLVYVLQSRSSPLFAAPQMDAAYHLAWAQAFAAGETFRPGEPFYRAPLYSWFLGACLRLFGDGLLAPRLLQALLGTATTGLTYLVGARALGRATGLLAAFGTATAWSLIYFDGELLIPTLAIPLQLLALWLSLRLGYDRRPRALLGAGVAWGLAAIARPTVLLLVPLIAAWVELVRPAPRADVDANEDAPRGGPRLVAATLLLLGFALPVLPLTFYNAIAAKDLVLISSTGGVNLWIGNHPASDGSSAVLPGARTDLWGGIEDARALAERETGRPLKASGVSRHYARKARAHVLAHPLDALTHFAWKLRLTWSAWELGNNTEPRFFARRFGPVLRALPLAFGWLAPLGLVGFVLITPRWRRLFPLWAFVPVQTFGVVLFFVNARFRLPLVPVLAVLAAYALVRGALALRAGAWRPVAVGAAAAVLLTALVQRTPAGVDTSGAGGLTLLGILALQRGDAETATARFEEALGENPRYPYALRGLGLTAWRSGRADDARAPLEAARALLPGDVETLEGLAEVYALLDEPDLLCAVAREMVAAAPGYAGSHFNLGRCLLQPVLAAQAAGGELAPFRDDLVGAREAFRTALALAPDFANAHLLGQAHLLLGEHAEAERAFAEAERSLPEPDPGGFFWSNHEGRVRALRGAGRTDEALRHAEGLWRRFQQDPAQREAARALLIEARRGGG